MQHVTTCAFLVIFFVAAVQPVTLSGQEPLATDPYVPLTFREKGEVFGNRIISWKGFAKSVLTAGINQWQDSPPEWGQGMEGYGRRYAHKIATRTLENGFGFVAAGVLREDPRYLLSGETGIRRRVGHALKNTILTRKDNGNRTIAVWRISGNYGAQFASNLWRPDRYTGFSDTMLRGTVSIGYDAATNLLKEFWPDIRKRLRRR